MDELRIRVLGTSSITGHDGAVVSIASAKARALLLYLAVTGVPHSRSALAGLLWGDRTEENARGSLRLALTALRRTVGGHLLISRTHVAFDRSRPYTLDWADLEAARGVPAHYRGGFLDDVILPGAPRFDDWVAERRQHARDLAACVLRRLAAEARERGDDEETVRLGRRLVEIDPLDEAAHRLVMEELAAAGQRAAALAQYETCRRILDREIGVPPDPHTHALRDRIATGLPPAPHPDGDARRGNDLPLDVATGSGSTAERGGGAARSGSPVVPGGVGARSGSPALPGGARVTGEGGSPGGRSRGSRRIPRPLTVMIGRSHDVEEIVATLRDADGRLVTLTGPGGVGKTRLAIAVAERLDTDVVFVPFAGVAEGPGDDPARPVVTALAEALGVDLTPPRPARDLLLAALRHRTAVVVMDNLEHLPCMAPLVGAILSVAPGVRVLATSRRRIGIGVERVHEVRGLPPHRAEELFAERARRVNPAFDPGRRAAAVARICAAADGLPLAVELAASLTRALPCGEIADLLMSDADLLAHPAPSAAPRHASMRQVFTASWRLLTEDERRTLAAVSVFAGGFTLPAALHVADTTPALLARLVEHSLIRLEPDGRYQVHELIRRFAAEHLTDPTPRCRHATWFAHLLHRHLTPARPDTPVRPDAPARPDIPVRPDTPAHPVATVDSHALAPSGSHPPRPPLSPHPRQRKGRGGSDDHAHLEHPPSLEDLEPEMDNIRAAWHHIRRSAPAARQGFLEDYWTLCLRRHYYAEAVSVVEDALADPRDTPARVLARWHRLAATAHFQFERGGHSWTALHRTLAVAGRPLPSTPPGKALALAGSAARQVLYRTTPLTGRARRAEDRATAREIARALSFLTILGYHRLDPATMLLTVLRHLNAAQRSGDPADLAEAYANFSHVAGIVGWGAVSRRYGRLADRMIARVADPAAVSRARLSRGLRLMTDGCFDAARQTLTLAHRYPADPRHAENCQGLLAELEVFRGRYADAVPMMAAVAERAVVRMGDDVAGYWCLTGQAEAMLRLAAPDHDEIAAVLKAAREATLAIATFDKDHFSRSGPHLMTIQHLRLGAAFARAALLRGDPGAAAEAVTEALRAVSAPVLPKVAVLEALTGLSETLWALHTTHALGDVGEPVRRALRHMRDFARCAPGVRARLAWATALLGHVTGDRTAARRSATAALARARELGVPYDEARAGEVLSLVAADPGAAETHRHRAAALHTALGTAPLARLTGDPGEAPLT